MNPAIWGDKTWDTLYFICINYPNKPTLENKQYMMKFFNSLQNVLPCKICRDHFQRNMREHPVKLDSRKALVYWLTDVRNEINGRNGKRSYTYEEIKRKYQAMLHKKDIFEWEDQEDSCNEHEGCGGGFNWVIASALLFFVIIFVYYLRHRRAR